MIFLVDPHMFDIRLITYYTCNDGDVISMYNAENLIKALM